MKKKTKVMIGSTALVAVLSTTLFLGATLAKYSTTVSAGDMTTAAKFEFEAKEGDNYFGTDAATIDIFSNTSLGDKLDGGADGSKIAPGSLGDFVIVLDNTTSEVDVAVTSTVTTTVGDNVNLMFAIGEMAPVADEGYTIAKADLKDQLETALNGTLESGGAVSGDSKTVRVYWKWVDNDLTDKLASGYTEGAATRTPETASLTIQVQAEQDQ